MSVSDANMDWINTLYGYQKKDIALFQNWSHNALNFVDLIGPYSTSKPDYA